MNQDKFPVLHRDGTVSYWSFTRQEWIAHTFYVSDEDIAAMESYDAERVRKHLGLTQAAT